MKKKTALFAPPKNKKLDKDQHNNTKPFLLFFGERGKTSSSLPPPCGLSLLCTRYMSCFTGAVLVVAVDVIKCGGGGGGAVVGAVRGVISWFTTAV